MSGGVRTFCTSCTSINNEPFVGSDGGGTLNADFAIGGPARFPEFGRQRHPKQDHRSGTLQARLSQRALCCQSPTVETGSRARRPSQPGSPNPRSRRRRTLTGNREAAASGRIRTTVCTATLRTPEDSYVALLVRRVQQSTSPGTVSEDNAASVTPPGWVCGASSTAPQSRRLAALFPCRVGSTVNVRGYVGHASAGERREFSG